VSTWKELKERRLVQIVVSYAVAGWVVVSIFGEVIDRGGLPEIVYRVLLILYFGGLVAATITGWFHGEKGHQQFTRPEVVLLTIVGLVTLGFTGRTIQGHLSAEAIRAAAEASDTPLNSLAVLYFQDRSRGEDLQYLADGITESLIDRLSESQGLSVLTQNASQQFRDSNVPFDSIAKVLEVGTLVDGFLEGRGDELRVTVSLVDGASGAEIQSQTVERPAADLFALQDDVADEVGLLLGGWLAEEVELRQARKGTENVVAWTLFQRGEKRRDVGEAALRAGDMEDAVQEFREADSLYSETERADPNWAAPLVQRAALTHSWAQISARDDPDLEPRNAEAFLVRGKLAYLRWRQRLVSDPRESDQAFQQALSDLEEATRFDSSLAEAWSILSVLHSEGADNTNAKLAAQRAYEADEFLRSADEVLFRLYATSYDLEQFRDATKYCDQGRARFPRHVLFRECRLWLLAAPSSQAPDPDPDEAWTTLELYLDAVPEQLQEQARIKGQILVAGTLGRAEMVDSAEAVLARSQATPDQDPEMELLGLEALIRLHMGQKERALDLLRTYLTTNPHHREGWQWTAHWWWRPLQEEPEFRALVAG